MILKMCSIIIDLSPTHKAPGEGVMYKTCYLFIYFSDKSS